MEVGFSLYIILSTVVGVLLLSALSGLENNRDALEDFTSNRLFASACFLASALSLGVVVAYISGATNVHFLKVIGGVLNFAYGTLLSIVIAKGVLAPSTLKRGWGVIVAATALVALADSLPILKSWCSASFELCAHEDPATNLISYVLITTCLVFGVYGYRKWIVQKL
ncbi:hypothetical protein [Sedimenticola selenatireducens]|uniref:hypothetical protein n=1 Tax=Sedimenticola selenatireducens TaxID=191960 RepID=UPI002356CDE9|nr:hypothetical protein [Sedimenticola selenatireducens]